MFALMREVHSTLYFGKNWFQMQKFFKMLRNHRYLVDFLFDIFLKVKNLGPNPATFSVSFSLGGGMQAEL